MVITGQQLGLFGGPLYTIYKAATAIRLAREAARKSGRPVVPMFWLADEDHDWDEVRVATILRDGGHRRIELPAEGTRQPVGRRTVDEHVGKALDHLEDVLPGTVHTEAVLAALRRCYAPGSTHRDAFARWLATLFHGTGLVLISADEPRLKRLTTPVLRREIEDPQGTFATLLDAGRALDQAGFHQQVTIAPGNLFLLSDEGRLSLDPLEGGTFRLRGTNRDFTAEDLLDLLESEPELFSPNVVLRPVMEDALLPVIAYVGGPGEIAYYAQLRGVYAAFGVPMPVVYPRAGLTIIEPRVRRALDALGLAIEDIGNGSEEVIEALHRQQAMALDGTGLVEAFAAARQRIEEVASSVRDPVEALDPTLARSAETTRVRLQQDLDSLERKVVRAQKRQHAEIRARLDRIAAHLMPDGRPQERVLSPVHFANRLGLDFAQRLTEVLSLDTSEHQVIEVV